MPPEIITSEQDFIIAAMHTVGRASSTSTATTM